MTIERDEDGLQLLGQRQRHRDMSDEDKGLHTRCLLVKDDDKSGQLRAITWADNAARIAEWEARGYVVAENPYLDPVETGEKKDVIIVHVPMKSSGLSRITKED